MRAPTFAFASLLFAAVLTCAAVLADTARPPQSPDAGRIDVILWFDTEDYLLPASDDAAKRVAELLTERGIHGTFKVVGEKARTLERRGRRDVIKALRRHTIAYHSDLHSVHPTPAEYLADCGLLDGMDEFVRREGRGAADVRRIFRVDTLACYGQPGSSWAPQAVAALPRIGVAPHGVPCYVDEGSHVGLDHQPFWFAGALNVYDMAENCTRVDLHDPADAGPARERFQSIATRLRREHGGGLVSIYYHPCEWVHRQFWDGVNFARGANPPREAWTQPPQRPPAETDAAFRQFAAYVDFLQSFPGVHFVTAADLPGLYPDLLRREGATRADLDELAGRITTPGAAGLDFQSIGERSFSLADQLALLSEAVGGWQQQREPQFPIRPPVLLGPDRQPPPTRAESAVDWTAFQAATMDLLNFIHRQHRIPARVFLGAEPVPPGDFLFAVATAYQRHRRDGSFPNDIRVTLGHDLELLPARRVAADQPGVYGDWIIHPAGFRAPQLLALARLQAWTLKPALRAVP